MKLNGLNRRETLLGLTTAMGLKAFGPGPDRRLRHPSPSAEAKALYGFLWSIYGTHTLTGQQEQNFTSAGPGQELAYLERVTGRRPALLGFDYIHPYDNAAVNERAIAWSRSGGVVCICWHWGAPGGPSGYEASKADFDLEAGLTPGTPENRTMLHDMDVVAELLKGVRDAGVPVLWRPLHEFSGQWFWWGRHGAEGFKALWLLMQDRFTRLHRLDNLAIQRVSSRRRAGWRAHFGGHGRQRGFGRAGAAGSTCGRRSGVAALGRRRTGIAAAARGVGGRICRHLAVLRGGRRRGRGIARPGGRGVGHHWRWAGWRRWGHSLRHRVGLRGVSRCRCNRRGAGL